MHLSPTIDHISLAQELLDETSSDLNRFDSWQLADLFVKSSFLASLGQAINDQTWLLTKNRNEDHGLAQKLVQKQMLSELKTLDFVEATLIEAAPSDIKSLAKSASRLSQRIIDHSHRTEFAGAFFTNFAHHCMSEMAKLSEDQNNIAGNPFTDSMYRAFDAMDDVLGLEYDLDDGMKLNMTERLYEGGAVSVQTSYATLLLTFASLENRPGALVLDLGSGFGRVGLTLGLLRPDVHFIGYEYVDHRVRSSQEAADRAGLTNVKFLTQDLSRADFKIPLADTYYMYDPFNKETYGYVLGQLIGIGKNHAITVVTKGRANTWATDALSIEGWTFDTPCDNGHVLVFRSPFFANSEA